MRNFALPPTARLATSFPGSLFFPSPWDGKKRDPGNEVARLDGLPLMYRILPGARPLNEVAASMISQLNCLGLTLCGPYFILQNYEFLKFLSLNGSQINKNGKLSLQRHL